MAPKDKTLLRSRDAALAAEKTEVLRDPAGIAQAALSQPPPFLKTLVGRFGLVELAGEGGMSRVYKAVDLRMVEAGSDDPHVAVKVLNIPFENVNDAMALLHREMRHLQDLVHPNIVRVFDCNRDGDTVFMTMEFLAGRTLTSKVRAQGFAGVDAAIALPVMRSIAAALEFAHGKRGMPSSPGRRTGTSRSSLPTRTSAASPRRSRERARIRPGLMCRRRWGFDGGGAEKLSQRRKDRQGEKFRFMDFDP